VGKRPRRITYLRKTTSFLFQREGISIYQRDCGNTIIVCINAFCMNRTNVRADSSLNSYMGIIPELERVFITIDHSLFLWDYVEG
jgi:hypothetical protein